MDGAFITFLNELFGHNIGTAIASILFMITAIIVPVVVFAIKRHKAWKQKIKDDAILEKQEQSFRESMNQVAENVKLIQENLQKMTEKQEEQQEELNAKLDDVWRSLDKQQKESRNGDIELENRIKSYEDGIIDLNEKLNVMDQKQNLLIESDKESIKSYIINEYYSAVKNQFIPIHKLQNIEARYEKYLQENGNTFVGDLMTALRAMPHEVQIDPKS